MVNNPSRPVMGGHPFATIAANSTDATVVDDLRTVVEALNPWRMRPMKITHTATGDPIPVLSESHFALQHKDPLARIKKVVERFAPGFLTNDLNISSQLVIYVGGRKGEVVFTTDNKPPHNIRVAGNVPAIRAVREQLESELAKNPTPTARVDADGSPAMGTTGV